ncbi:hypothetical protein AB3R30_01510 [Leptolyngbyaceae cyanobacterium UHCC 1019]
MEKLGKGAIGGDITKELKDRFQVQGFVDLQMTVGAWHTLREANYGQYLDDSTADQLPNAAPLHKMMSPDHCFLTRWE